ncbi:hypothetical protein ACF1AJ_20485 [Leifsonia sp. NPDC014704]|uniref:VG15 protein n=1 Tax=Leifsonia sp. NPDC014704 TaxID=3364123 RepID=UPI0036F46E6D
MSSPAEQRRGLQLLTGAAVDTAGTLLERVSGSPEARRAALLEGVPEIIGYYTAGTAALAADFYQDLRERDVVPDGWQAELVVADRTVKIRRAVAWSAAPLFDGSQDQAAVRLAEVVQFETAKPYRDTILANRKRDPLSVGWKREASPTGCRFCRFLAARGAIYKHDTATFAAHPHCTCTAVPVFQGGERGPEASVGQYVASRRRRSERDRESIREWLDYFDETGKTTL